MVKYYILASVVKVIQHQLQGVDHTLVMMNILKAMFGEQNRAVKVDMMMIEGTPMRENCLSMIVILNTLKFLGAKIDGKSQVDMVLQFLPNSFNHFRLNVSMSKKDFTLAELMNELIATEAS